MLKIRNFERQREVAAGKERDRYRQRAREGEQESELGAGDDFSRDEGCVCGGEGVQG